MSCCASEAFSEAIIISILFWRYAGQSNNLAPTR